MREWEGVVNKQRETILEHVKGEAKRTWLINFMLLDLAARYPNDPIAQKVARRAHSDFERSRDIYESICRLYHVESDRFWVDALERLVE